MAVTSTTPPAQQLPFSTGNAAYDSLIRSIIIGVSGIATGAAVGWLNREGFHDPNLTMLVGGAVFGLVASIAGGAWGVWQHIRSKQIVTNEIVPQAVEAGIKLARSEELKIDKTGIPVPVTPESAAEIVKNFAPIPPVVPAAPVLKAVG